MGLTTKEFAERPPLKGWLIAVLVLAVMAVFAVAVKSCSSDTDSGPDAGAAASSSVPQSSAKGSVLPQSPSLQRSPADADWLTAAPHRISWQRVDGIPFPFSDSDGPARITGAVATGYSHTPQGATLAAAHISFRLAWSPDFMAVLEQQTRVDEVTRQALISARSHSGAVDPEMVAAIAKAPVAFKVSSYTDTKAVVYLAFPTATNQYRFAPVAVVWADNDWKYSSELDPATTAELPDSESLDGFTSFEEGK
jgi:hypothetical protein